MGNMMNGSGMGWMMGGMAVGWVLAIVVLILAVMALVKYLRSKGAVRRTERDTGAGSEPRHDPHGLSQGRIH